MVQANPQILQVFFFTLVAYYILYSLVNSPDSCYCCSPCYKNLANKILILWDWFEIIKLTFFAWLTNPWKVAKGEIYLLMVFANSFSMVSVDRSGWSYYPFYMSIYVRWLTFWLSICRNLLGQMAGGMPQAVTVTPEERQAIERVSLASSL